MSDSHVTPIRKPDEALSEERAAAVRIVAGIVRHDGAAERELVTRYSRGLRYLLLRRCHDEESARDLLQETFIVALEKLRAEPIREPERLAGYLKGIAENVARSANRLRRRMPLPGDDDLIRAIPDEQPRAFDRISAEQTASSVRELLDSMPVQRDRELLRRYYLYDQDKAEICRALGLDSLHFNRVLYRAKHRFREILESADRTGDRNEK